MNIQNTYISLGFAAFSSHERGILTIPTFFGAEIARRPCPVVSGVTHLPIWEILLKKGTGWEIFFRSLSSPSHLLHATGEKRLSHWWETRKKPFPVGDPPSLVAAEGNSRSDSHFSSDGLCGLFVISWWNFVLIRRTDRHVYHTLQGAYLSIYSVKTTILIRINCPCLCTYANQSDPHPRLQQNILLLGEFAK